jgi:hypothetical protein
MKRVAIIGRNKPVGPDYIPGDILKMGGEAMIPYLVRLIDIPINNDTISGDWKKATVVPVYKGGDRSVVQNYRPVSFTLSNQSFLPSEYSPSFIYFGR